MLSRNTRTALDVMPETRMGRRLAAKARKARKARNRRRTILAATAAGVAVMAGVAAAGGALPALAGSPARLTASNQHVAMNDGPYRAGWRGTYHHHYPKGDPVTVAPSPTSTPANPPTPTAPSPTVSPSATPSTPPSAPPSAPVSSSSGFPDASNTGVPAGTKLLSVPGQVSSGPGWYFDPRGWVEVDGNGAVLQGLSIPYNVDVSASDVTIKDDQITLDGNGFGVSLRHTSNVTVEDNDISGGDAGSNRLMVGVKDIYGDSTGTQVLGNNIWYTSTGIQIYAGLIEGNYIHDMGYISGDHINGITANGETTPLTIEHNTVLVDRSQTDAIGLFEDTGVIANVTIEDNLLAGGGYTIYGGQNPGGPAAYNVRITGNRISTMYYPNGGYYGYAAAFTPSGSGNVWSGNVWDRTGRPIKDSALSAG
jgi:phage baseplate assembly protein gpV